MLRSWKSVGGSLFVGSVVAMLGCSKEVPPANPSGETAQAEPKPMPLADAPDAAPVPPVGDATSGPPAEESAAPAAEDAAAPAADDQSADEMIQANLAALSAEDRALAMKQKICPVGGPLGSMGVPIKVSVAGHDVFICCAHCEEPLKADPAKHLATIGLQPAEPAAN